MRRLRSLRRDFIEAPVLTFYTVPWRPLAVLWRAVEFVVESRRGSTSSVQRRFKIGYNRAARLIEQMEMQGIVSPAGSNGQREVLAPSPMRD